MAQEKPEEVPEKSLEYWLTRATDPYLAESSRPDFIKGFCEQVNEELEGHQIACRLLAHKVQSPYEKEALHALTVLDACVRNCGQRFHNEIAKFRFLNELIKILSPKYLGNQTGEKVKQRTIELIYAWKQGLRHLPKIKQAYEMLKEQAIISQDPTYMDEIYEAPPQPPKPKLASFEDEEKARVLAQLLKSKNADDLQAANRLIKSMVKAEDQKMEKMTKRSTDLQTATNNARLLAEMAAQYDRSSSGSQDRELMKELADSVQKLRPALYRYAGEAAEGDEEVLSDVLSCNDEVSRALEDYKTRVESHVVNNLRSNNQASSSAASSSLLNFDIPVNVPSSGFTLGSDLRSRTSSELSITSDDVLMLGGGGTPLISRRNTTAVIGGSSTSAVAELSELFGQPTPSATSASSAGNRTLLSGQQAQANASSKLATGLQGKPQASGSGNKGLLDLDELSESLIQRHLPTGITSTIQLQQNKKTTLRDLTRQTTVPATYVNALDSLNAFAQQQLSSNPGSASESGTATPAGLRPTPMTPHPTPTIMSGTTSPSSSEPSVDLLGLSAAMAAIAVEPPDEPVKPKLMPLDNVEVALESIKPSSKSSVTLMDRDQLKVILHFTANRPRQDVLTTVVSITSSRNQAITDVRFEARVRDEDDILIKLLQPTATVLPAYNPIFPQTAITQIMLIAAIAEVGTTRRVPLEFTLNYEAAEQRYSITGCITMDYWQEEARG